MHLGTLGLALALAVAGCGSGAEMPDLGADLGSSVMNDLSLSPDLGPARRDPTDHPPPPHITNHGGQPLDHIKVWTVVWMGDEQLGADVNRFDAWMLRSRYWSESMVEYGVGPGDALGVIVLPSTPPATIDYGAFDAIVAQLLPTHPADRNTVFSFVVDKNTMLTAGAMVGCRDLGGYHSETAQGVVYAVNLQCNYGFGSLFDSLTVTISHELEESATDAHPISMLPGWYSDDFFPSEVGDLCTGLDLTLPAAPDAADGGAGDDGGAASQYLVERVYSAARAAAGNIDPCVPAPNVPWFGAAIAPASLDLTPASGTRVTQTVDIEPFAYGAVGSIDWTIYTNVPGVSFRPSHGVSQAGDTIPVELTVLPSAQPGMNAIVVYAKSRAGNNMWFWPLTIE